MFGLIVPPHLLCLCAFAVTGTVLVLFTLFAYPPIDAPNSRRADPANSAVALASRCATRGRKRVHNTDEIAAKRLVNHVNRAGFVVVKRGTLEWRRIGV